MRKAVNEHRFFQQKKRESRGLCAATGCGVGASASTERPCHACGWALVTRCHALSVCQTALFVLDGGFAVCLFLLVSSPFTHLVLKVASLRFDCSVAFQFSGIPFPFHPRLAGRLDLLKFHDVDFPL